MSQLVILFSVLVMWLQTPAAAPTAGEQVTIAPISISETRSKNLVGEESGFGDRSGIELVIRVQGDSLKGATSFGKLKVADAKDDTGTDLKVKERPMFGNDDDFKPIQSGMLGMLQKKGEKGFRVKLDLGVAARKAMKISLVKGEFQVLAGGKEATVTAKSLPGMKGKTITDPKLKEAGVEITVVDPKKAGGMFFGGSGPNSLALKMTGTLTAIQEVEVLDKAGKSATSGHMSSGSDNEQTVSYDLKQPLDDTMTLQIKLLIGQKAVTVPFEVKDVELP